MTTPFRITSLNLACSKEEEKHVPLHTRLPAINVLLQQACPDMVCLQELRWTGPLTEMEVLKTLNDALAASLQRPFRCSLIHVSPTDDKNAFSRGVIYDAAKVELWNTMRTPLPHPNKPRRNSAIVSYFFKLLGTQHHLALYNVHAPCDLALKTIYWMTLGEELNERPEEVFTLAVGDLNKFTEERPVYQTFLAQYALHDHIPADTITFTSFPHDLDPAGQPYQSSLDAVLTEHGPSTTMVRRVEVVPTQGASDHSLIAVDICV